MIKVVKHPSYSQIVVPHPSGAYQPFSLGYINVEKLFLKTHCVLIVIVCYFKFQMPSKSDKILDNLSYMSVL